MQLAADGSNFAAIMAGGSIIASLATLAVVSFNGGKITQKVADHDEKFAHQGETNVYFHEKISEHSSQLARLEGIDLATRHHDQDG